MSVKVVPNALTATRRETHGDVEPSVPDGWKEIADPKSGRFYYTHKASGTTQWERPADLDASPRALPRKTHGTRAHNYTVAVQSHIFRAPVARASLR